MSTHLANCSFKPYFSIPLPVRWYLVILRNLNQLLQHEIFGNNTIIIFVFKKVSIVTAVNNWTLCNVRMLQSYTALKMYPPSKKTTWGVELSTHTEELRPARTPILWGGERRPRASTDNGPGPNRLRRPGTPWDTLNKTPPAGPKKKVWDAVSHRWCLAARRRAARRDPWAWRTSCLTHGRVE